MIGAVLRPECTIRRYVCQRLVFFFQAEDGIRDYKVTGVQTCALPISDQGKRHRRQNPGRGNEDREIRLGLFQDELRKEGKGDSKARAEQRKDERFGEEQDRKSVV